MSLSAPPGVFDIIPEDLKDPWKSSSAWQYVERIMRETAQAFGYQEIRTPIFEKTELFMRGVGETTDIVSKEMYTFIDRGDRSLTLRPEGTAPVVRSYIENNLKETSKVQKFFYIGPMLRYERAQAGRYRQHHQFGVESFGNPSSEQDAEIIVLAYSLYTKLGLKNLKVKLNSVGDTESRKNFRDEFVAYLEKYADSLSEESRIRLKKNPLRILDSKDPKDKEIVKEAPSIHDFLSAESKEHFRRLRELLDDLHIPYEVDPLLVRGLDYYNKTVFEIVSEDLGSQNSVGGGGRYDGLLKTLSGPDIPATGFGTGIERILQIMLKQNAYLPPAPHPLIYFIPIGEDAKRFAFKLASEIRMKGLPCEIDLSNRKVGKALSKASDLNAKYAAVIGENELKNKEIELKELSSKETTKIPFSALINILEIESLSGPFLKQIGKLMDPFQQKAEADFFFQKIRKHIDTTQKISEKLKTALHSIDEALNLNP